MRAAIAALVGVLGVATIGSADPVQHELVTKPLRFARPHVGTVAPTIYLERCKGGCVLKAGADDAKGYTAEIPEGPGPFTISEYQNEQHQTGTDADAEWAQVLKCVQETYSPYGVQITDQKPADDRPYNMTIVAGLPAEVGLPNSYGGVGHGTCDALNNAISFTFANFNWGSGQDRIWELCGVVAQETGHNFGLDHVYEFNNGTSTVSGCKDPMTYRPSCGQKFFRNELATCGEYNTRPCKCGGGLQNSHQTLLNVFGPGTPITTPPTLEVTTPTATTGTIGAGFIVNATAGAQRGIKTVDLYINGWKWASASPAAFGPSGQPTVNYGMKIPDEVPDGVMDIVVKASDDIDTTTTAPTVTVTKGAACTDATTCLAGMKCEAGKCFWDEPAGVLGETCTYEQYCISGMCVPKSEGSAEKVCSRSCVVSSDAACEAGFECVAETISSGACLPKGAGGGGGGCSTSVDGSTTGAFALGLFGVGAVLLRRRRR
ncbi:MAG TPA: MYXO-CTERM sorting domain-containing protein [Kofleriaceae bacterium]|jgi:MYXO-CTERM domain-containing protein